MIDIGIITGTGFYEFGNAGRTSELVDTEYGQVEVGIYDIQDYAVGHIARHGERHQKLPNMINHRANILSLHKLQTQLIIGTTICGVTNKDIALGNLLLFNDQFFPDNRLPDGNICTYFTAPGAEERGHYIFGSPFHQATLESIQDLDAVRNVTYGYANGPRFNSVSEIHFYKQYCDAISQTSGPEAILAGELEIPYVLLGFGVDYANGVMAEPTPVKTLNANMEKSVDVFRRAIETILQRFTSPEFEGFIYRFE